jgi:D-alanyl-D-alanine carboxypeptidase (penicillin-binding protein 5/6)
MPLAVLRVLITSILVLVLAGVAAAQSPYGGRAPNYYVFDVGTGQVLAEQNANIPLPPASMSKLVTLAILFDALRDGRVRMEDTWAISSRAQAMGGSSMFLETRDRPTTEDMIRGIAIVSGNDAAVAVAEGLAGTEEAFAVMAQRWSEQLGMTGTNIVNASGWPDPDHRMSLRDLGILANYIITEHPEYYRYLGEREFEWNGISQPNRVPLLDAGIGLDGLKTGHTEEAGFSLVGSARQGSRRVIFVFSGLNSVNERVEESERIINWAFRQFAEQNVIREGQTVGVADVWLGAADTVPLVAAGDVTVLLPVIAAGETTAVARYDGPVTAPITEGDVLGELVVEVDGMGTMSTPLLAGASVAPGGFMPRVRAAAAVLSQQLGL